MCNGQAFVIHELFSGQVLGQLPNRVLACQACAAIEVESLHVFVAFVIHFFLLKSHRCEAVFLEK